MSNFRASVVIPTKDRYGIFRETVLSILDQDEPVEIIVLDDASSDGTPDKARAEFPQIRVESFRRSRGPAHRRNQGARLAQGEFLFTIDDDCTLPHADTIRRTIEAFDDERIGAVTIPFINIHKDTDLVLTVAPDEAQTYASFEYYGGMVALRRDIFLELGGYRPFYFYMNEEGDYSVRLLNAGYYIKAGTAPPIDHHESPIRASKRRNQLGTRNQMLFAWYNIPFPQMLPQMVGSGLKASAHLCNLGHPDQAVRGFVKGWLAVGHELNHREPVSPQCYKLSREIRRREYVPFSEIEARLMKIRSENAM